MDPDSIQFIFDSVQGAMKKRKVPRNTYSSDLNTSTLLSESKRKRKRIASSNANSVTKSVISAAGLHSSTRPKGNDLRLAANTVSPKSSETRDSKNLSRFQAKVKDKLTGARFRWINEKLYTITSSHAFTLFKSNPEMFEEYHNGFRHQAQSWPTNPSNIFISRLADYVSSLRLTNQKSTQERFLVADFGCGDAKIAETFARDRSIRVLSFDFVSKNDKVIECDVANLPLPDDLFDIGIFCLSLMGTNYVQFLHEAWRVIKISGQLWIAEIRSRFEPYGIDPFLAQLSSLGFELVSRDDSNTMFVSFEFKRTRKNPQGNKELSTLLQPCLYKKR